MTATMPLRSLHEDLQEKAILELSELPDRVEDDIRHIQRWLDQQPHLNVVTDDQWTLNFLRGCKFNLQKSKDKLDMYYTMRSSMPEIYTNRDPLLPEIQEVLRLGLLLPLLETDGPAAPRVIVVRCEPIDPARILFPNIVKVALMIIDILLNEDDNFVIAGQDGLIDFKGIKMSHIFHLNLNLTKKVAIGLQRAYPTRPKGFHCVNTLSIVDIVLRAIKPLLTEKLRKRINFYSSATCSRLHENISPTILPKEYGGNGASLDELTDHWKNKVETYRNWFLEDSKYGSDETKRKENRKTTGNTFGVEQSFGNLNID